MAQGFAAGSFVATCSYYDEKTRPERGSEPFFLSTPAVNGEPDFQGGTYDACGSAAWTRHEYDALGRRTKTIDPDRGTEQAFYNAAGEVIRSIDGAGMDVRLDMDALGRTWRRQSGESSSATAPPPAGRIFADGFETPGLPVSGLVVDVWRYDTAGSGKGLLHWEERTEQGEDAYRRTMSYDNRGRPSNRATLLDGSTHNESWAYDTLGRTYRQTDASGSTVEHTFTTRGYAYRLRNASTPAEVYQQITAQNARGQITDELRGAAAMTRSFHPQRGWLTGITTTASTTLQNLSYAHDALGNLTQRRDLRGNQTEDFTYDGLNRLKTASVKVGAVPAVTALGLSYDILCASVVRPLAGRQTHSAGRAACVYFFDRPDWPMRNP